MKFFISQPMNGFTEDQIKRRREQIIEYLETQFSEFEVIDNILTPKEHVPLWYLGKSIELLSCADLAVFDTGWQNSRECKIEFQCCIEYSIKILFI